MAKRLNHGNSANESRPLLKGSGREWAGWLTAWFAISVTTCSLKPRTSLKNTKTFDMEMRTFCSQQERVCQDLQQELYESAETCNNNHMLCRRSGSDTGSDTESDTGVLAWRCWHGGLARGSADWRK